MFTRELLDLDKMFSEGFFVKQEKSQDSFLKLVNFPLPDKPSHLKQFLASPNGNLFRDGSKLLLNQLKEWASLRGMDLSKINHFQNQFLNYSGQDQEINKINFPLYQQGMRVVASILGFLNHSNMTMPVRESVIKNLLNGLDVCGPGVLSNLFDAFYKLASYCNFYFLIMSFRRKIAEQYLLEIMGHAAYNVPDNMRMHYVNAALNHFQHALAYPAIEDKNIRLCRQNIITDMINKFIKEYQTICTPATLIENIIIHFELDTLEQSLGEDLNVNKFSSQIEQKLNLISEEANHSFFYIDDIITSEDYRHFELSWKSNLSIYLTIFNRLCIKNIFNPIPLKKIINFNCEHLSLHFFQNHSLKLSFIHFQKSYNNKSYMPLGIFMIELITKKKYKHLINYFYSLLNTSQRSELSHYIFHFLKSNEYFNLRTNEKSNFAYRLLKLSSSFILPKDIKTFLIDLETYHHLSFVNLAAKSNHLKFLKYLLSLGINPRQTDQNGLTPILFAIKNKQIKVINCLIAHDKTLLSSITKLSVLKLKTITKDSNLQRAINVIHYHTSTLAHEVLINPIIFSILTSSFPITIYLLENNAPTYNIPTNVPPSKIASIMGRQLLARVLLILENQLGVAYEERNKAIKKLLKMIANSPHLAELAVTLFEKIDYFSGRLYYLPIQIYHAQKNNIEYFKKAIAFAYAQFDPNLEETMMIRLSKKYQAVNDVMMQSDKKKKFSLKNMGLFHKQASLLELLHELMDADPRHSPSSVKPMG